MRISLCNEVIGELPFERCHPTPPLIWFFWLKLWLKRVVMLSVLDDPLSLTAARSGTETTGAVVSIVTTNGADVV